VTATVPVTVEPDAVPDAELVTLPRVTATVPVVLEPEAVLVVSARVRASVPATP